MGEGDEFKVDSHTGTMNNVHGCPEHRRVLCSSFGRLHHVLLVITGRENNRLVDKAAIHQVTSVK